MRPTSHDLIASLVVFLVALPLCMGISIASGVPPALGLMTGIVGGIVVGSLSGAPLQVSGPAAGLTVLVADLVTKHGIAALGPAVLVAGLLQIVAGRMHLGQYFRAMSPAVIYGMLAGIGVLIFASQFHVMLDTSPQSSGVANLLTIPESIGKGLAPADGTSHHIAALLGIVTLVSLLAWDRFKPARAKVIPGALVGVVLATSLAAIAAFDVRFVEVPTNLLDAVRPPSAEWFAFFAQPSFWVEAVALSFIASAETLLSASAVDRMQTLHKTDYDKELAAQGVGNTITGLLGALPMTGVIVRSSANVLAGARTRASTIMHGIWLLGLVVLLPGVLRLIPTAALGAILVFTGYKLMDFKNVKHLRSYGIGPVVIYAATVIGIVAIDLLTGVILGVVLSLLRLVYRMSHLKIVLTTTPSGRTDVHMLGAATFLKIPQIMKTLENIAPDADVHIHLDGLAYIDHACLDMIKAWRDKLEKTGGQVALDLDVVADRSRITAPPNAPPPTTPTRDAA